MSWKENRPVLCAEAPGGVPSGPGFLCAGRQRVPEASAAEDGIRKWAPGFPVEKQEQRLKSAAAQLSNSEGSPALGEGAFLKPSTPLAAGKSKEYGLDIPSLFPDPAGPKGDREQAPLSSQGQLVGLRARWPLCAAVGKQRKPLQRGRVNLSKPHKSSNRTNVGCHGVWSTGLALSVPRGLRPASQLIRAPESH